jgi:hypothetical protein
MPVADASAPYGGGEPLDAAYAYGGEDGEEESNCGGDGEEGELEEDPMSLLFHTAETGEEGGVTLIDSDDEEIAPIGGAGFKFYQDHLDDPLYSTCNFTLRQTLFALVSNKEKDAPFVKNMRFIKKLLPNPNYMVDSLYMVKKLLGCSDISKYERHACINCCMVWPHTERKNMYDHIHDQCDVCREKRFYVKHFAHSGRVRLTPRRAWWNFGVGNTIKSLNRDKEFVKLKRVAVTNREEGQGYFGCSEAKRLNDYSGGTFFDEGNSYWELAADAGQMFDGVQHSTVLILLRCSGLPYAEKGKKFNGKPIMIISGPREATNLQCFLAEIVDFFQRHGKSRDPFEVEENVGDGPPRLQKETIWLTGVYGDSPIRQKAAMWLAHCASLGCGYCAIEGKHFMGAMRFLGYSKEFKFNKDGSLRFFDGAKLSDQEHRIRSATAEAFKALAEDTPQGKALLKKQLAALGCTGYGVFTKKLEYVNSKTLFVLPVWHALIYGIAKSFFNVIFEKVGPRFEYNKYKVSYQSRKLIEKKEKEMFAISEYTHAYTSLLTKRGYYTMDMWLHFILTWSTYIFGENEEKILHPDIYALYLLLRDIVIFT